MAQFDVYSNPNKSNRNLYPFLVDIQSPLIDELATRIVLPLGKLSNFNKQAMKTLTPVVDFECEELILLTPQIASVPAKILSKPVGTMREFGGEIIAALDFAIAGV